MLHTSRLARGSVYLMLRGIAFPYCYDNDFNYCQRHHGKRHTFKLVLGREGRPGRNAFDLGVLSVFVFLSFPEWSFFFSFY